MRNVPLYNFPAFDAARDMLVKLGHEPISPADMDRDIGFDETCDSEPPTPAFVQDALRRDFEAICGCDAIAFLPGWETSAGAQKERVVAETIGCSCWRIDPALGTFYRETVIGLSGYARAGKDTVASIICEYANFEQRSFATPLKAMLAALDPRIGGRRRVSDLLCFHDWEGAKGNPEVRRLLQRLGTEAGRRILGDDIWIDTLFHAHSSGRIVVSDVRFPNEAEAIKDRGGIMVRISRPGYGPVNGHPSETALDSFDFDAHIMNDGSIDDLHGSVAPLIDEVASTSSPERFTDQKDVTTHA
jgi:hypothetical protein